MGKSIYFTEKELLALIDASSEWCEIMSYGDEKSNKIVEDALNNGLGSALHKLYKDRNGEKIYKSYKKI